MRPTSSVVLSNMYLNFKMEQISRKCVVITFANQKGGVGKTTLCTLFANYLAAKGKSLLVVDCDGQQTIYDKRKKDLKSKPEKEIPYNVQPFNISNIEHVKKLMDFIQTMDGVILIDAPGSLSQKGLIPLFASTDYIVCPFQFEQTSINSTVTFILFIQKLMQKIEKMKTGIFFVVNRHDKRVGKKDELEIWAKTEKAFNEYGHVVPRVEQAINMQRYNTFSLVANQDKIVGPAFDYIYKSIFEEKEDLGPNGR